MPRRKLPPSNELALLVMCDVFTNDQSESILRFWQDQWWRHDGKVYKRLEQIPLTLAVRDWVQAKLGSSQIAGGLVRSIIAELRFQPFVYVPTSWDMPCVLPDVPHLDEQCEMVRPNDWINLANGIFDLSRWEAGREPLLPHTASFFSNTCTEYGWDPTATAPVFRRFLRASCTDLDQIDLCLQVMAWFVTWDNTLKKVVFLFGESNTGKSVLINHVIVPLVGDDAVSNVPLEQFGTRFGEAPMRGKKLNVSSEAKFIEAIAVERFKAISGGDKITQDVKNQEPVTFVPTARLLASGNSPIRYADSSNGIWNRQIVLHFNNVVPRDQQDRQLGDKLRSELAGIFTLIMLAWLRLRSRGEFCCSAVSERLVRQFRLRSNPPRMFVEECYVADDSAFVLRGEIMDKFRRFCLRWNYKGGHSRESVFDELRRQFPHAREVWRSKGLSKRDRAFVGIRFSPEDASELEKLPDDSLLAEAVRQREEAERSARIARDASKKAAKEAGRAASAAKRRRQDATRHRKALEEPKELKKQTLQRLRSAADQTQGSQPAPNQEIQVDDESVEVHDPMTEEVEALIEELSNED